MKASELRDMKQLELTKRLDELKQELFNLRFQHAINQLDNPQRIVAVKKEIARVKTIMHEMELGITVETKVEEEAKPKKAKKAAKAKKEEAEDEDEKDVKVKKAAKKAEEEKEEAAKDEDIDEEEDLEEEDLDEDDDDEDE